MNCFLSTFLILALTLLVGCSGTSVKFNFQENSNHPTPLQSIITLQSSDECLNYLHDKNFYSNKARLEFHNDDNAYIFDKINNQPLFAGFISIDPISVSEGRIIRIHDTIGSDQVIIMLLKPNGDLVDLSDNAVFQIQ